MNWFIKFLLFLQSEMTTPKPYGWYHLMWIGLTVLALVVLYLTRKHWGERQQKWVLGIYGFVAATTELLKQISWSFEWTSATQTAIWDYQWYAAPFQFCSTPIYLSLLCFFLKKGKLRDGCLACLSMFTILGGLMTLLIPDSCFCSDTLANIHTMWLHCGGFVLSMYLLMSGAVKPEMQTWVRGVKVFLALVAIALALNLGVYNSGILGEETFNMFYISPYFISVLPIFDAIQQAVPYPVFLALYIVGLTLGSLVIFLVAKAIAHGVKKYKQRVCEPVNK